MAAGANPKDLLVLAQRLSELSAQASEFRLFADHRELQACASCGLIEGVRSDGFSITHIIESLDVIDGGPGLANTVAELSNTMPRSRSNSTCCLRLVGGLPNGYLIICALRD
jgi:hypothetical protein